jgi:hypothetical protein
MISVVMMPSSLANLLVRMHSEQPSLPWADSVPMEVPGPPSNTSTTPMEPNLERSSLQSLVFLRFKAQAARWGLSFLVRKRMMWPF